MRAKVVTATLTMLALGVAAGCGGDSGGSGDAAASTGPIKVWLSNNPEEIAWGEQMVKAWNADHPEEEITAQEIPAGKTSEEVIGAAITAGSGSPVPEAGGSRGPRRLRRRDRVRRDPQR
jgi:multiple sugar transport system substrate-binding protein